MCFRGSLIELVAAKGLVSALGGLSKVEIEGIGAGEVWAPKAFSGIILPPGTVDQSLHYVSCFFTFSVPPVNEGLVTLSPGPTSGVTVSCEG